jgi:hypothetical protein
MKNSAPFITLALVSLALAGCSSVAHLGVIELAPNVPRHIKVGDADWTITAMRDASGKQKIIAESTARKVTLEDLANSAVPPTTDIGTPIKEIIDLSSVPIGVEITGYFGGKLARYTLKPHVE